MCIVLGSETNLQPKMLLIVNNEDVPTKSGIIAIDDHETVEFLSQMIEVQMGKEATRMCSHPARSFLFV